MALTVETGIGLADADALDSLDNVTAYHAAKGNSSWASSDYDDTAREEAIRRATAFLCNSYRWQGVRTHGRDQALMWPRAFVMDQEGYAILSDEIPREIKEAVAEIALRELVTPGTMNPDFTASELVKREKVGSIEVEYALTNTSADGQRPVLTIVRDLVSQFLAGGGGNVLAGGSYRV